MIRKLAIAVVVLLILGLLAAAAAARWAWTAIHEPWGSAAAEAFVVEPGTSARSILDGLEARGLLRDARLARLWLVHRLGDPPLLAGEYRFDEPLSTPGVLDKLIRGEVVTYPVTLIEGLTLDEAAEALAAAGFGDVEVFRREMERTELIADLDPDATRLEGYLYPDTYHFARGTSEAEVVSTLVRTFRSRFERDVAPLLSGSDLGVRGVVTLASIVEKETQRDDERTLVASVYANRLRIGMGLYADPTIIYAKKLAGTWDGNLRRPDLKLDSPYNTYVVPGLPPGPICSPTVASMVAALRPADSEYLYFVSRNDGTHVFSRTLAEHNRNVYVWQKKYWRDRWAREGRSSGG